MINPEFAPDEPKPLDEGQIIDGLKAVESKWNIPDLVSRYSQWVPKPELAYEMLEYLNSEMKQKFGFNLFVEIRSALESAQEMTDKKKTHLIKLGNAAIDPIRNLFR